MLFAQCPLMPSPLPPSPAPFALHALNPPQPFCWALGPAPDPDLADLEPLHWPQPYPLPLPGHRPCAPESLAVGCPPSVVGELMLVPDGPEEQLLIAAAAMRAQQVAHGLLWGVVHTAGAAATPPPPPITVAQSSVTIKLCVSAVW